MVRLELERHSPCKCIVSIATLHSVAYYASVILYHREGFNREGGIEARGIIPRAIEQIFGHIQKHASPRMRFLVRASYLQIYNEQVRSHKCIGALLHCPRLLRILN